MEDLKALPMERAREDLTVAVRVDSKGGWTAGAKVDAMEYLKALAMEN
jgi:hypothetical protein